MTRKFRLFVWTGFAFSLKFFNLGSVVYTEKGKDHLFGSTYDGELSKKTELAFAK